MVFFKNHVTQVLAGGWLPRFTVLRGSIFLPEFPCYAGSHSFSMVKCRFHPTPSPPIQQLLPSLFLFKKTSLPTPRSQKKRAERSAVFTNQFLIFQPKNKGKGENFFSQCGQISIQILPFVSSNASFVRPNTSFVRPIAFSVGPAALNVGHISLSFFRPKLDAIGPTLNVIRPTLNAIGRTNDAFYIQKRLKGL